MMRAVRFMVQKGWKISPETIESIRKNAGWLKSISRERVRDELNKMLVTDNPSEAMHQLNDLGLLPYITPELQQAVGMGQNKYHKHDVWLHSLEVLKKTNPALINRLMALFHDIGKVKTKTIVNGEIHFYQHEHVGTEMAREILSNLKYPNEIIDAVCLGIKNHMRLKQSGEQGELVTDKALRKFIVDLGEHLESVLDIMAADNASHEGSYTSPEQISNIRKRIDVLKNSVPKNTDKLPVTGDDLKTLRIPAGPIYKEILDTIRDAIYGNPNLTRDEAFEIVQNILKNK
jgi:tRNA nucleotidyltransferase (CCA-adding enzyme)